MFNKTLQNMEEVYKEVRITTLQEELREKRRGMKNVKLSSFNASLYMFLVSGAVLASYIFRTVGDIFFVDSSYVVSMISMLLIVVPVIIPGLYFFKIFNHYVSKVVPVMDRRNELFTLTTGLSIYSKKDSLTGKTSDFYTDEWLKVSVDSNSSHRNFKEIFVKMYIDDKGYECFEIK